MATTFFVDSTTAPSAPLVAPTHLHWKDASGEVRTKPLTNGSTTVGGGPRCIVRVEGAGVRPLHCVIQTTDDGATVRRWSADTNLNGGAFTEAPFRVGDRLSIAGVELWAEATPALPEAPADVAEDEAIAAELNTTEEEGVTANERLEDSTFEDGSLETMGASPVVERASLSSAVETPSADTPPIPTHLLQPWLNASLEPSHSEAAPEAAEEEATSDTDTQAREPVAHTDERFRSSAQQNRKRARRLTSALRAARKNAEQVTDRLELAIASRDELATKLLLTTTELHDCRSELEQAQTNLEAITVDRDDYTRLYELAKGEVDELEIRVAGLQGDLAALIDERGALLEEQSRWTEQREQLEAAVAALEDRLVQPSATDDLPEALTKDTDAIDFASTETIANAPAEGDEVDPQDPASQDERIKTNAFDWGVTSETSEVEDTPPETSDAQAEVSESSPAAPTHDPWSGVWDVEANDESAETPAADETPSADISPSAPSEEEQAAKAWLSAFGTNAGTPAESPETAEATPTAPNEPIDESATASLWQAEAPAPIVDDALEVRLPGNDDNDAIVASQVDEGSAAEDPTSTEDPITSDGAGAGILSTHEGEPESPEAEADNEAAETPSLLTETTEATDDQSSEDTPEGFPAGAGSFLEQAGILAPGAFDGVTTDSSSGDESLESSPAEIGAFEPSGALPESVEELIADEQPSSEAPISFLDKYADSLPADETEETPFTSPVGALNNPEPEPAFATPPAAPSPAGDDGEESIEDYMAKLMQRMRGDEDEASASAAPVLASIVPTTPSTAAPEPAEPAPTAEPEPVVPLTSLDELRGGPAPEEGRDMSSLRALANETARDAISVSQVKIKKEKAIANLIISVMAMGCGGFLAATAPSWISGQLFGGVASFAWAACWFANTLRLLFTKGKASPTSVVARTSVTSSLPITPEQD